MGVYSWGVEVTQPIFQGFRLLSTYQKAALQADSDKASLRKAELDMTEQVQTAFLEYLKAGENTRSMRDSPDPPARTAAHRPGLFRGGPEPPPGRAPGRGGRE